MKSMNRGRSVRAVLPVLAVALLVALAQPAFAAEPLSGVVNVNIASVEELVLLPGIGESRAKAIVALRENRGGFDSVDELVDVKGIGNAMLAKLRPYVSLEGRTTAVR
ncbi:MAG: ComEA family DNA-binding protein [Myxococcota bacterium]|nr:ComEA family DNA-binding protein [Myxococcota bacterium]